MAGPLFSFGSVADVQFCDKEDGTDFSGITKRYFRGSLACLERAVAYWDTVADDGRTGDFVFIAQLGDIIDGMCNERGQSEADIKRVLDVFERCQRCKKVIHLIGNHELYNIGPLGGDLHPWLQTRGNPSDSQVEYYGFDPVPSVRVVCVNSFHLSTMLPEDSPECKEARALMDKHNPNDLSRPCNFTAGLSGLNERWVPYNGGLGKRQISWLREELRAARSAGKKVIILTHCGLHPRAAKNGHRTLVWDYLEVLDVIREAKCVVAVLAGHNHKGGYCCVDNVHHITFQSPLNKGSDGESYGHVEVFDDRLVLVGPRLRDHVGEHLQERCVPRGDDAQEVSLAFCTPDTVGRLNPDGLTLPPRVTPL